ncbi:hypothetical protein Y1Q_0011354 [Alligator mississippiensis]|uniref:Uncharacterized protein n=1 Tax=Alligator mississippiensis TaxID=8496 RepID=A0A151NVH7_ALLMI|nr:hypothetical protein Y1Q_0011354 [Alligator mississippiensis]
MKGDAREYHCTASRGNNPVLSQEKIRGDGVRRASKEVKPGSSLALALRNLRRKAKHARAMWKKTLGKPKPASHDGRAAQPASSQMSHARGTTRRTLLGRRGHEHDQSENPVKRQCSFLETVAKKDAVSKGGLEVAPAPSQVSSSHPVYSPFQLWENMCLLAKKARNARELLPMYPGFPFRVQQNKSLLPRLGRNFHHLLPRVETAPMLPSLENSQGRKSH